MADQAPTSDEFFGSPSQSGQAPTADEFFAPQPPGLASRVMNALDPRTGFGILSAPPTGNPATDQAISLTGTGRVLQAFGQGAKNAWGAEPVAIPDPVQQTLKKSGFWDEYANARNTHLKAINETLFRPAAAVLDRFLGPVATDIAAVGRGFSAGVSGLEHAFYQAGKETGSPGFGQLGIELTEATASGALIPAHIPAPPVQLPRARALGVIGEGESGYFGTKAPEPVSDAARAEAVKQTIQEQAEAPQPTGAAPEAIEQPGAAKAEPAPVDVTQPAAAPDIHQAAREIAPDTFKEYDSLTQRRDTYRRWMDELRQTRQEQAEAAAPHTDEIAELHDKMEGATPRLVKKYQARLDELEPAREAFIEEKTSVDSPDMARIRAELQKSDYRMRDLAPDVAKAYREAQERQGPSAEAPTAAVDRPQEPAPPESGAQEIAPDVGKAIPPEAVQKPSSPDVVGGEKLGGETKQSHLDTIAADVAKKLEGAGRPKEESAAAGQIIAAHYEARAARFKGENGNAYELFARDAPTIRAARQRTKELAQSDKTLDQGKKGSITLGNARNTIKLFKDADASTFIHETGHDWLEELFRDAGTDGVVESVKTDAATVRDWLGVKEGENIPTKAHEKFARGFERYMMEGVAPSKKLATVFAQFKDWLTKIYQTVQKLRSPINDDIRAVFDRMLAENPEKTVIAPDRAAPEHMVDFHEREAESTPPEQAHAAGDQIRADIDEAVKKSAPEVHDELPHKQAGGIPRADTVPDRGSDAAESIRGSEADAAERSEVAEGGNKAAAEGGTGKPATGEPDTGNDLLARPAADDLVDKAGNIVLENLGTPEDVNAVIRQISTANSDFIAARRGVISDAEVIDLANDLGMDAATLDRRKLGEAFNAEQVMAARKLLIQSATDLREVMAKAAKGQDADVMAYAQARDRHIMIQRQVAGLTAEAGRALRAFRKLEGQENAELLGKIIEDETGRTLNQLKKEAALGAQLDTPAKVSKFMNDSTKPTFLDMVTEFWINSLLSGPKTHVKNIIGNAVVALNSVAETAGASVVGRVLNSAERVEFNEAKARMFGIVQGARDGVIAAKHIMASEDAISMSAHTVEKANKKAIPGKAGEAIRIPTRLLSAEDEFFKAIAYRQELNAIAYREANKLGLTGDAFDAHVAQTITSPSEAVMEAARKNEEYQTFTNPLGPTGRAIQNFANSHFLAKFLVPFIRTPVNLLKYAGERTALGLASKSVRETVFGSDTIARDTQISRMAIGTGISVAVAYAGLAMEGAVTGGGPSDPKQRAALRMTGWQPYSVRVGDMYYSYQWLDPFSTIAGITADMTDVAKYGSDKGEGWEKISADAMGSLVKSAASKTSLRGISDFLQMASDPDRYGENYIQGFAAGFVPGVLGQTASIMDPQLRETRTALDTIKAKIPGMSQDLLPRRDVWGNEMSRGGALGPDILSSIYESQVNEDPVNQSMLKSGYFPSYPSRKIRGVDLTDQQYDDYSRIAGRMAKMQLDNVVKLPGFSQLPALERLTLLRSTVEHSRESARSLVMLQNPELIQKAIKGKLQAELGEDATAP